MDKTYKLEILPPAQAELEEIGYNRLPGTTAFATVEQAVSGVKVFVLADLRHTVSPSFTL